MRAHALAGARRTSRQPLALGADEQRHAGSARSPAVAGRRAAARAAPATSATRSPGQLARRRARARARRRRSRPCSRAPPSASGGRRSRARARRSEAPNACARAQHRADVAGVARRRAGRRTAARRGAAPALLVDADHARARAERRDARERRAARHRGSSSPPSPQPAQPVALERRGARRARRPRSGPRPRPGSVPLRSRSRLVCRRRRAFRRGFCGDAMWVIGSVGASGDLAVGTQKGRRPVRSGAREARRCRLPGLRQPTPRGRPRQNVGTCRRRARRCRRAPCGRARRRPATGRA